MLTKGLMIFHTSLAAITKTPELVLDNEEAKGISETTLTLMELYDLKPDPRVEAWINFAAVMGLTYGTRIVAIRARRNQEQKETREKKAGVYDANGVPMGTTDYHSEEWPINSAAAN